jgi:hypothetical protein
MAYILYSVRRTPYRYLLSKGTYIILSFSAEFGTAHVLYHLQVGSKNGVN